MSLCILDPRESVVRSCMAAAAKSEQGPSTSEWRLWSASCRVLQVLYALTAGIAGYVAAVTYKVLGGTSWVRNTLLTATLFCGPLLVTFSFLNTVAIVYRSTAALPFGTIVIILVIWAVVTFPLTVLGGIAGKNSKARPLPTMHASPPSDAAAHCGHAS